MSPSTLLRPHTLHTSLYTSIYDNISVPDWLYLKIDSIKSDHFYISWIRNKSIQTYIPNPYGHINIGRAISPPKQSIYFYSSPVIILNTFLYTHIFSHSPLLFIYHFTLLKSCLLLTSKFFASIHTLMKMGDC